jgi:hypothetical protein
MNPFIGIVIDAMRPFDVYDYLVTYTPEHDHANRVSYEAYRDLLKVEVIRTGPALFLRRLALEYIDV